MNYLHKHNTNKHIRADIFVKQHTCRLYFNNDNMNNQILL